VGEYRHIYVYGVCSYVCLNSIDVGTTIGSAVLVGSLTQTLKRFLVDDMIRHFIADNIEFQLLFSPWLLVEVSQYECDMRHT
jgi:hypothetical protein